MAKTHNPALDEITAGATLDEGTEPDGAPTSEGRPARVIHSHKSFTRGLNPRAATAFVRARYGADGVAQLARALPEHVVADLGGPGLRPPPMSWVPFMSHATMIQGIDEVFGGGDLKLCTYVGREMAHHDLPALVRPVAKLLSPSLFIDMAMKIWRLYHSHGTWEVVRGDREMVGVLVGRPENHRAFCVGMAGWIEATMLYCGAVECEIAEERCAAKGGPVCSFRMTWKEKRDTVRDRRPRAPM